MRPGKETERKIAVLPRWADGGHVRRGKRGGKTVGWTLQVTEGESTVDQKGKKRSLRGKERGGEGKETIH